MIGNGHAGFGRGTLEKGCTVPRQRPTSAIMDPDWGHVVIKISGHPPFGAQIILNGHNYVSSATWASPPWPILRASSPAYRRRCCSSSRL